MCCVDKIRWVDKNPEVFKDFIGFSQIPSIDANALISVIRDVLRRQCFDGVSVMAGVKIGVATHIANEEKRAVFMGMY